MSKACKGCGEVLPLDSYYVHPMMTDGHLSFCKPCVKARVKKHREENDSVREYDRGRWRNNPHRRDQHRRVAGLLKARSPHIRAAQSAVARAIRTGALTRPDTCEQCQQSSIAIEAAHIDYSRPLDVRWLCRRCHRRWDQIDPKTKHGAAA